MAFTKNNPTTTGEQQPVQKIKHNKFPLDPINFVLIAVSVVMIILGFAVMAIGPGSTADHFEPEIFSTRRLIIGPSVAFLGFCFMVVAIMYKKRS